MTTTTSPASTTDASGPASPSGSASSSGPVNPAEGSSCAALSSAQILHAVHRLLPLVREDAAEAEATRRLTPRVHAALRAAGAYQVGFSRRHGGPEMPLLQQTEMVELVATADAGTAWNLAVLAATGFYAERLGEQAFAELYPTLDRPTCGSFHPKGRALAVEGGYRVSGTWSFGSGIRSAELIVGGAQVHHADGNPLLREDGSVLTLGLWLPVQQVRLHDDWQVVGLRASSSESYSVQDVFVPAGHTFDRFYAPRADADPLIKHVDLPFYSMAGICIGIAQHAVDLTSEHLLARARSGREPGERTLALLGEAATSVRAARALVLHGVREIDEAIFSPGQLPAESVMARGDAPLATELARTVLDRCADVLGSAAIHEATGFEKLTRDLVGVSAHASSWRSRWIDVARTHLAEKGRAA
ncbi:acyl-CoA dehydrogenase family protein [Kineococcus arenarius]|uniref:acyl-CoA dehydrogenase family protein n=1 Tax=Kineococcus sp. SYSU DK007 TaxID=3383128 RepID=UPI003D7CCBCD